MSPVDKLLEFEAAIEKKVHWNVVNGPMASGSLKLMAKDAYFVGLILDYVIRLLKWT